MAILIFLLTITIRLTAPEFHTGYIERTEGIHHITFADIDFWLKKYHIRNPRIVKSQICIESAFLTSNIFRLNNNCFGMKYTDRRKTTAIGERFGCAVYSSIEKSIEDYAIWQNLNYRNGDYLQFLKRIGYATDKDYIKKLKQINN